MLCVECVQLCSFCRRCSFVSDSHKYMITPVQFCSQFETRTEPNFILNFYGKLTRHMVRPGNLRRRALTFLSFPFKACLSRSCRATPEDKGGRFFWQTKLLRQLQVISLGAGREDLRTMSTKRFGLLRSLQGVWLMRIASLALLAGHAHASSSKYKRGEVVPLYGRFTT